MVKNKTKKKSTAAKKRKVKSKFRPSFKERCVYSFAKSIAAMSEIFDIVDDDVSESEKLLGIHYMTCYQDLSHSIEMLCKATLEQRSPYLLLEKIDHFDNPFPETKVLDENTCGARIALARASKLFRIRFTNESLGKLINVIDSRNRITHNEYYIQDFKKEKHFLGNAFQIVVNIYNEQFRNANLVAEANDLELADIFTTFTRSSKETTDDFRQIELLVKRLKAKGRSFVRCTNCYYPFAEFNSETNSYKCLWCEDSKIKKICSNSYCNREFWTPSNNPKSECDFGFHIKIPSDFQHNSLNYNMNFRGLSLSDLSGISKTLNLDTTSSIDSDFLNRETNPKSDETERNKAVPKKSSD